MSTAVSATGTSGLKSSGGTRLTVKAPASEQTTINASAGIIMRQGMRTLRANRAAAHNRVDESGGERGYQHNCDLG